LDFRPEFQSRLKGCLQAAAQELKYIDENQLRADPARYEPVSDVNWAWAADRLRRLERFLADLSVEMVHFRKLEVDGSDEMLARACESLIQLGKHGLEGGDQDTKPKTVPPQPKVKERPSCP